MSDEVRPGRPQGLATIPDLESAITAGAVRGVRKQVAHAALGAAAVPLLPGTESFAFDALAAWHRAARNGHGRDVAAYILQDAVVAGAGQVWVDGHLVTSPDIMPPYVAQALDIASGGAPALHHCARLPQRTIAAPCLVAVGSGTRTYGHFLIEMLFRILVARLAWPAPGRLPYKLLLDAATPDWLRRILADDLDIRPDDIEIFAPWQEQVALPQAILPSRVFQDDMTHPVANQLIDGLLERLRVPAGPDLPRRIFVARGAYRTPEGARRTCLDEPALIDLASRRHGFAAVQPELISWREQIALFRHADVVIGLAGSGLHSAMFGRPGTRVGSIGMMNLVQSEIGALRGQHNAYLTKDIDLATEFSVDPNVFEAFVHAVCS